MTANINYLAPKKTLNCLSINISVKLEKEISAKFVVVDIINNKICIREALDMDDGLKVLRGNGSTKINFNCKRHRDFIGKYNVCKEDEYFVLYKRKNETDEDDDE